MVKKWQEKLSKKELKRSYKKATSKIANLGGKIIKIGSKALFWISLASTAYELYQFYQEETKIPNPPQQLTHKMENPPTPILQAPPIQQSFNPTIIQNEESTLTNNNEVKEEKTKEETNQEESETGNLNNP
ncbi:hypothetical protein RS022_04570 [Candidatus Phytoplasma rubi]|uniref:Uncharacterized protein n=1 Tax=Candidatus Phytoplasma rubi TaxID=399025 RepID=A0ABY7BSR5_9MOLU|nr:hypothetical protein [Candidatus Phytoplasma rubi]WAN63357.1 hypothetical protein RS022_04570 [Candidatus Phytoplasma rubi]